MNAAAESDMYVFVAGLFQGKLFPAFVPESQLTKPIAQQAGKRDLYRTGAAFVSCRLGISGIPPLTSHDLGHNIALDEQI